MLNPAPPGNSDWSQLPKSIFNAPPQAAIRPSTTLTKSGCCQDGSGSSLKSKNNAYTEKSIFLSICLAWK